MAKKKKDNSANMTTSRGNSTWMEGLMSGVTKRVTQAISDADEAAAATRVAKLRETKPDALPTELVSLLIQQKCWQTGAVGAVTSSAALIPGLGTLASLTFGVAADIGMTFKMQAELVLEIAAAHGHELTPDEKQKAILIVTGISAGANKLLEELGKQIAQQATERLAQKSITKAIPLIGVAASAGSNILTTYIIGWRADAYFRLGPEAVGDWLQSIRATTGVDEREIINWLTGTTERSWELVSSGMQSTAGAVIVAGQSAGEIVVVGAGKVSELTSGAGQTAITGLSSASGKMVETGQWAAAGIAATAGAAANSTLETGKWVSESLAAGMSAAAQKSLETGKWAGQGLVESSTVAAGAVADAGKWVSSWFTRTHQSEEEANQGTDAPLTETGEAGVESSGKATD